MKFSQNRSGEKSLKLSQNAQRHWRVQKMTWKDVARVKSGGDDVLMKPPLQRREFSEPVGTIRLTHSPARALAESDRRVSEGKRSRSFCRILRAQAYSAERIVIPSRRNGGPGRMGRIRPNTPRAIKLHPAATPSNRLNLLVTGLSSCTSFIISTIRFHRSGWAESSVLRAYILVFGRLFSAFFPLLTTGWAFELGPGTCTSTLQGACCGRY
jgi:hypothetical protein